MPIATHTVRIATESIIKLGLLYSSLEKMRAHVQRQLATLRPLTREVRPPAARRSVSSTCCSKPAATASSRAHAVTGQTTGSIASPRSIQSAAASQQAVPASTTANTSNNGSSASSSAGPAAPEVSLLHSADGLDGRSDRLAIRWSSGIESKFHHVWLRDHCRCPECYHPKTKQRLLDTFSVRL